MYQSAHPELVEGWAAILSGTGYPFPLILNLLKDGRVSFREGAINPLILNLLKDGRVSFREGAINPLILNWLKDGRLD